MLPARIAKKRALQAAKASGRLLRRLRKFSRDPRYLIWVVRTAKRSVVVYHEDVTARTNKELLAFIQQRVNE